MTQHIHRLVWALPISVDSLTLLQRLGVAIYSPGYTNSQRLQILTGTLAFAPDDPEALNWQTKYSSAADGTTADYYAGSASLTTMEWARMQARIPYMPTGLLYARLTLNGTDEFELVETNLTALGPFIGVVQSESGVLAAAGLRPWQRV